jgi:hypothetical protein
MKLRIAWVWAIVAIGAWAATARGQGTTVQLPTYRTFQSGGSVLVPDRGSALLGGVSRARSSRSELGSPFRPFGNRAIGSELSAARASVSVYIHDFAAMEEELERAAAASARSKNVAKTPLGTSAKLADFAAASDQAQQPAESPLASLEEIRRQRRRDAEARDAEARDFLARGIAAEASGKLQVARIYYQIAAKRASGTLHDEILARLEALRRQQAGQIVRRE